MLNNLKELKILDKSHLAFLGKEVSFTTNNPIHKPFYNNIK